MKYKITVKAQTFDVEIESIAGNTAQVCVDQIPYAVSFEEVAGAATPAAPQAQGQPPPVSAPASAGGGTVCAPIPGVISEIKVKVGQTVGAGQVVATMEAMKMENNLNAPMAGTVREIRAPKGTEVATGDVVMLIG